MKNFKKLFASLAIVAMLGTAVPTTVLGAASYSTELQGAYDYAYGIGVTTQSSIDTANMYGSLLRSHMAKMMVNYAKEVKGLTPDTSLTCTFTDVANQTEEMQGYIKEACQMGLMGVGITAFNPNGTVTRAQFGTVLDRVLNGSANDVTTNPYYAQHLQALSDAGIMTQISHPDQLEVRGYVMLMMQRADVGGTTPAVCTTPENVLSCSLGLDTCPAECQNTTPVVKAGTLNVSLDSSSPANGTSIPNVGISTMASLKLNANQDVSVNSIHLKKVGLGASIGIKQLWFEQNGVRISSKAALGSDSSATISFSPSFVVKSNETIDLVANVSGSTSAQYAFLLDDADTTAQSVNINVTTPTLNLVDYTVAKLTMTATTAGNIYKLGDAVNAELGKFTLQSDGGNGGTDQRDVSLKSITFNYSGNNGDLSNIENLALYDNSTKISTATTIVGRKVSFTLDANLTSSQTKTYYIRGDVVNADTATDTYSFYVKYTEDIVATEASTNFRTIMATPTPYQLGTYTINGGDVVLTKDSSLQSSINVAPATNDVVILKGTITVKDSITMGDLNLTGTFNLTGTTAGPLLTNVTLHIGNTTSVATVTSSTSAQLLDFYGNWTLNKGTTPVRITVNVKSQANGGTIKFDDLQLNKFDNPQYVAGSQSTAAGIGTISSSTATITATNVTASRTDGLSDRNIVQGSNNVTLFVGNLVSTNTQTTTVNSFEFDGVGATSAFNGNLSTILYVNGVAIKNASFNAGKVTFNSLNITVKQGTSPEIKLVGSFGSSITGGSTMYLTLTGFSATDANSQNVAINSVNSASVKIVGAGSAVLSLNSAAAQSSLLNAGTPGVELGRFDIKAQDDDIQLTDIYFKNGSVSNAIDFSNRINSPMLYYVDGSGIQQFLANGTMVATGMIFENISTNNTFAAGTTKTLIVKAGLNSVLNTGDLAANKVQLALYSGYSTAKAGTIDGLRLVSSNGSVIGGASIYPIDVVGKEHTVVRGNPILALTDLLSDNTKLMDLGITAKGNEIRVKTLSGTLSNFTLASGATLSVSVYKDTQSGTPIATGSITAVGTATNYTSPTSILLTFVDANGYSISAGATANLLIIVGGYNPYVNGSYAYTREFKITDMSYNDVFQNGNILMSTIAPFSNIGTLPLTTTFKQ